MVAPSHVIVRAFDALSGLVDVPILVGMASRGRPEIGTPSGVGPGSAGYTGYLGE